MNYVQYIKRHFSISPKTIKYDIQNRPDPDVFQPNGSQIYHGYQGEGKTASMYHATMKMKKRYPKAVLVSNLPLTKFKGMRAQNFLDGKFKLDDFINKADHSKHYIYYETYEELIFLLKHCRNGELGVIFNIDEIHNYFHSHDSKSMPMWVVQVFSQQRKQRLVILGTVQDWEDLIKAIRRQIDNLVECHKVWYFIFQLAVDPRTAEMQYGEKLFDIRKKGFFFLSKEIRDGMDTFHVIDSGREILGGGELEAAPNLTQKSNRYAVKQSKDLNRKLSRALK